MTEKQEKMIVSGGGENIFEDLDYLNPQEAKAKSDLARQIRMIIQHRKLTQKQAAEKMGIDQPKVSDIVRGRLGKYSIDRLIRFLRLLGRDVEIRVMKHKSTETYPFLMVTTDSPPARSRASL